MCHCEDSDSNRETKQSRNASKEFIQRECGDYNSRLLRPAAAGLAMTNMIRDFTFLTVIFNFDFSTLNLLRCPKEKSSNLSL
ncbi:MAG: hypothetical protein UV40_C0040G0007 [Parcubacteria group bacterium GW2011_GWA1_42_7]|nr:MAG: hypothetical protein UV34_C0018G0002 [Parcubacteria group bacterium GW2011_GWB1_42_6]KKS68912.1 MAG: hypothetical protein UV40_C0040G0007 [Parcubacteria group bacterium GW2011_GWA1_42_7]KKS91538.1 MAG: hypothetical protein UV67_C0025G0002 [Parcubacteria group bacterium GW2011_GWC1_43_12]